ncbi:hypothetical protein ACJJTC_006991 [Scirpophaga incertulas]
MAVKKCCVGSCNSCSSRSEDIGVSYHKFPKNSSLYKAWTEATQFNLINNETYYVCSRHFCKSDFINYKESKYVLKPDAVPSIFPWSLKTPMSTTVNMENTEKIEERNSTKDYEEDNIEAIKKFIENEEQVVEEKFPSNKNVKITEDSTDDGAKDFHERMTVASSMMDMVMNESEDKITKKNDQLKPYKHYSNSGEKGVNSMSLSVGSKVEAKDFSDYWFPAQIIEVDYEEMEVLVHYDSPSRKHDEWINVNSVRLRPLTKSTKVNLHQPLLASPTVTRSVPAYVTRIKEESPMPEEKLRPVFTVGERCLARWKDSRRFLATIIKDLGNDRYEVLFDDGCPWKCSITRLYKLKDSDSVSVSTPSLAEPSVSSPKQNAGPSSTVPLGPAFHKHLFDPTRDYLGSKTERREMKRKLNIKEIFNIGQKRYKKTASKGTQQRRRKPKIEPPDVQSTNSQSDIPDAVASIIGTIKEEEMVHENIKEQSKDDMKVKIKEEVMEENDNLEGSLYSKLKYEPESDDSSFNLESVSEEEDKLKNFDQEDIANHEEVIDRIKEVINKLEDGFSRVDNPPIKAEIKPVAVAVEQEIVEQKIPKSETESVKLEKETLKRKKLSKINKSKKLRLLQEKRVKKQVEKVKSELEEMKKQVEEMRKQMMAKTEELAKGPPQEMPVSFLLPGEWCCRWVNGQPVGKVSELETEGTSKVGLPRRSVEVEDKRLPPGWSKHLVRRSFGNSAGKWDVVLISPDNRRFHVKSEMRHFLETTNDETIKQHEHVLMDFGVHLKLSRRMGWVTTTPDGVDNTPVTTLSAGTLSTTSPLVKRRPLSLKRERRIHKKKQKLNIRLPKYLVPKSETPPQEPAMSVPEVAPLEEGYVYVGSLKVQIIDDFLRCPAEGCFKNFRNDPLLKMHIAHYHNELLQMLGETPKVLDLAYARTVPPALEKVKQRDSEQKTVKVKITKPSKRSDESKLESKKHKLEKHIPLEAPKTPSQCDEPSTLGMPGSPKHRHAFVANKSVKRPRVLLPVRRPEPEPEQPSDGFPMPEENPPVTDEEIPSIDILDFEAAISTHTVTKPGEFSHRKNEHKKLAPQSMKSVSEDEDWFNMASDMETRSSIPGSCSPDSKGMDQCMPLAPSKSEEKKGSKTYMYTETGERIKIVNMKQDEIINCHCGIRDSDGLMVQCELCLCWQHALCHNIREHSEVPAKFTCSICLNPRRGRRSRRFLHDQDRLYEGLLPGARPSEPLRRSHELSGNLHRMQDALHALRVKYYVATKKDHPKLYLWAKDWENGELTLAQEKTNSDYSDLNVMISGVGKENLPVRHDDPQIDIHTSPSEEQDRFNQRDGQLGSQSLLSGLLASPAGASLDLPINDMQRVSAPQPEAPIENGACRERLLRHIQRCQALIDARLDSIEAQVAELESQDPSFEDDETADYFPRTKQTIQMLMRDLDTMEELGVIT